MDISKTAVKIAAKTIISSKKLRNHASKRLDKLFYNKIVKNEKSMYSENARKVQYDGAKAIYKSAIRNMDKGYISADYAKKLMNPLINALMANEEMKKTNAAFTKEYGVKPGNFIVLSPTKKCNLKCIGCYASCDSNKETLDYETASKIVQQCHDDIGMRFFVFSGGEPLMYESNGKTILDIPREHPDCFFLMYTNGTLITKEKAKEIAELGNITPAISVEGYEKETDCRRGKGIYSRILNAMQNLREAGVPFGVSVTATKKNANILVSDEFYDKYLGELGASYMWIFQFMPIGREITTELCLTPMQRLKMFEQWKKVLHEKEYFIADFWNSAFLSDGCIAYGKNYFYIDWNGNIMPCVFVPYYTHNVKDFFSKGEHIGEIYRTEMFKKGREWQNSYHDKDGKLGNMLKPCSIRDNHKEFMEIMKSSNAKAEDESAKHAFDSKKYHDQMIKFDNDLSKILDPYWNKNFAKK